jgi:hypothetical protein
VRAYRQLENQRGAGAEYHIEDDSAGDHET